MKQRFLRWLYVLCQCTWGLPQTLVGFVIFLLNIRRHHFIYKGAVATQWKLGGSVSLGLFLFLGMSHEEPTSEYEKDLIRHEYGHTIQSLILGPLFLPIIGLPSVVWAGMFQKYRKKRKVSYYRFYTERWANKAGKVQRFR